ncbi:4Fe-4S binding protein [Alkaliphilus sp. MSJ-5]|uniref:Ferredoxin n=1 Tax=Alkaliphilus flagellatus TaxID=2841507 RepID=A0ABS6G6V3_9FIRM|nr:4Fe-4S dicluster domain-containing protein [Alkaliphilus flagellatus]MBU5678219.1 4Fe-4S binding protein [Alkaliphilus flagellatus]
MEWSKEAEVRIKKAPFFVKNMARKKAEEVAKSRGKTRVDIEDIEIAKGSGELEDLSTMDLAIDGLKNTNFRDMALCGGIRECPLTLFNDEEVARIFDKVIKEEDLEKVIKGAIDEPILYHKKFKAAISGCPNSCSHPQIKDISIVGYSSPKINDGYCIGCYQCVKSCPEKLVTVDKNPRIDIKECIDCGRCIRSCPTESIRELEKGYRIYIGGRLGRRPHLAKKVVDVKSIQELEYVLRKLIVLYKQCIIQRKRFSKTVEESTIEEIQRKIGIH